MLIQTTGKMTGTVYRGAIQLLLLIMIMAPDRSITAQTAGEEKEFHQSYPLAANGTVSLNNPSGAVRVRSWNEDSVKVDAVKNGRNTSEFSQVRIQVTATADRVEISTVHPRGRNISVSVDYNIFVPKTVNLDAIRTASGEIEVSGPIRRLTAGTASGGISVNNVTEDALLSAASGNISAKGVGGNIRATTASGKIIIDNAESSLRAQAASGSVDVRNVRGDVHADSLSDNITISDVKGRVNATTLSGNISLTRIDNGVRARAISGRVQISDSKGRIDVATTSDSIILTDLQCQEVVAKTTSGDVRFSSAMLTGGNYDFESFSGAVTILLPADAGFNLTARTDRDNLKSDFAFLTERAITSPRRGTFTTVVGNGGSELRVATFSGTVFLKKR